MAFVVTEFDRVPANIRDGFAGYGVATVHEAQGRKGLLASYMRPIYRPCHIAATAVTCLVAPGDNWMIHVAVEQCREGDVLVVAPSSPCEDGYFGDLLGASLKSRGVRGLVIDAGVRDIGPLTEMGFPVWSKAVFAQGTVKASVTDVNRPLVCAGAFVRPGDLMVADDDGVVVVRKEEAAKVLADSKAREEKEAGARARFEAGELSLDIFGFRNGLVERGLKYIGRDPEA